MASLLTRIILTAIVVLGAGPTSAQDIPEDQGSGTSSVQGGLFPAPMTRQLPSKLSKKGTGRKRKKQGRSKKIGGKIGRLLPPARYYQETNGGSSQEVSSCPPGTLSIVPVGSDGWNLCAGYRVPVNFFTYGDVASGALFSVSLPNWSDNVSAYNYFASWERLGDPHPPRIAPHVEIHLLARQIVEAKKALVAPAQRTLGGQPAIITREDDKSGITSVWVTAKTPIYIVSITYRVPTVQYAIYEEVLTRVLDSFRFGPAALEEEEVAEGSSDPQDNPEHPQANPKGPPEGTTAAGALKAEPSAPIGEAEEPRDLAPNKTAKRGTIEE